MVVLIVGIAAGAAAFVLNRSTPIFHRSAAPLTGIGLMKDRLRCATRVRVVVKCGDTTLSEAEISDRTALARLENAMDVSEPPDITQPIAYNVFCHCSVYCRGVPLYNFSVNDRHLVLPSGGYTLQDDRFFTALCECIAEGHPGWDYNVLIARHIQTLESPVPSAD